MQLPELMTISEFATWARIGRTKTYQEISSRALKASKIGNRTIIRFDDAKAWLDALPSFGVGVAEDG